MKIHPLFSPEDFIIEALRPYKTSPFVMYCFPGDADLLQYKPMAPVWHIAHLIGRNSTANQTYPVLAPLPRDQARTCLERLAEYQFEFLCPWTRVPGNDGILEYALSMAGALIDCQFLTDRLQYAGRIAKVTGKDLEWITWEMDTVTYPETFDPTIPDWVRKPAKYPSISVYNYDDLTGRHGALKPQLSIVEFIG